MSTRLAEFRSHFVVIVLAIICALDTTAHADLFVSPSGSDANIGTIDLPLQTLAGAQKTARSILAKEHGGVNISLMEGTYYLPDTLRLTAEDSGTEKNPVVWQAVSGQHVVISGGCKLALSWVPYKDGIFQARVPDALTTDQLFVNGTRQILARYPNYDSNAGIFDGTAADCISPERVARWANPVGGILHAMHPSLWGDFSYLITGKNSDNILSLEGGWQGNRPAQPHKKLRYVENIFEELDSPGEWFLNNKTHVLYYYPTPGLDLGKATVEAVRLKQLVEFSGSQLAPVKWVTFKGITFCHTSRTFMETKEPLLRSDWTISRSGAVLFDGAENCGLDGCFLDQVGGNAVFVNKYNRHVNVRGCRIDQSGAGGVLFVGDPAAVRSPLFQYDQRQSAEKIDRHPGPQTDNYPADCLVEDCLITRVGRVEKQVAGVGLDMCARIKVRHCSIYDVPRAGINIGDGCWGGDIIEFCDVFDTVKETGDHGSFNSWGRDRYWLPNIKEVDKLVAENPDLSLLDAVEPIEIRNNRWRCDHGWDIDLDDGSSNYHIHDNLCLHGGIKNREGFSRIVENNVIFNNSFHCHVWFDNSCDVFAHNIVFTKYQPIGMPRHWGREIDYNVLEDPDTSNPVPADILEKASHQDLHSLKVDPIFVDPAHGDYSVREGSPALAIGFKNFPMNEFGVTSPALRSIARTPSFDKGVSPTSTRDHKARDWMGAKVRNIIGLGEQSAHGLSGETGVLVLEIAEHSPLDRAGLKVNDVILSANDSPVDTTADLAKIAAHLRAGEKLILGVSRDERMIKLTVETQ